MPTREEQRRATRQRIVDVAADLLTTQGSAGTTTLAVQHAAALSRGALLHHFPSREELLAAAVGRLVDRNRAAAAAAIAAASGDAVTRAVEALATTVTRPEFSAELGLWAAARSDPKLRAALRHEERTARGALYSVVDAAFGPELTAHESYPRIASLTVQFLRGLSIAQTLRDDPGRTEILVRDWAVVVRHALDANLVPTPPDHPARSTR